MVKKVFVIALFALALASTFNSCYYDNEEELYAANAVCDTTNNVYNGRITAIISQSCLSGCHEQAVGSAGIILEGYTNLKNEIINGTVMCAIRHEGCSPMPKNQNKLSDCDINNLQNWIDKGYPEN
ncbi:MAG: hypothetical protein ACOVMR_13100 [Flavobacteriales bacterium]|jgi:hypothetical protein